MINNIYKIPMANFIVNIEKLKIFPLRSGTNSYHSFSTTLKEVLVSAVRQEKEIKT